MEKRGARIGIAVCLVASHAALGVQLLGIEEGSVRATLLPWIGGSYALFFACVAFEVVRRRPLRRWTSTP